MKWLVLLAALAFGVAPFVTDGFAGFRPDQFPIPQNNAPVQPMVYAFSIWSVIYVWLLTSAVYGAWRAPSAWGPTRTPMIISLAIGAIWIKVATLSVIWATILIWAMLATALWALFAGRDLRPRWTFRAPTGLYAGWLTAAACVALGLTGAGYGFGGQVPWALGMISLASAIGITVQVLTQAPTYAMALIWALFAILLKTVTTTPIMAGAAGLAIAVLALIVIRQYREDRLARG